MDPEVRIQIRKLTKKSSTIFQICHKVHTELNKKKSCSIREGSRTGYPDFGVRHLEEEERKKKEMKGKGNRGKEEEEEEWRNFVVLTSGLPALLLGEERV